MVCKGLEELTDQSIQGFLTFPLTCDHYFYAKMMAAFFIIISSVLFLRERDRVAKPDYLSALGVSAIATIFISLIGTLIGIITTDVFIEIFVIGMIFIALWIFKD